MTIDQLVAYGGAAQRLAADVSGNQGLVHVKSRRQTDCRFPVRIPICWPAHR